MVLEGPGHKGVLKDMEFQAEGNEACRYRAVTGGVGGGSSCRD